MAEWGVAVARSVGSAANETAAVDSCSAVLSLAEGSAETV
jgi:hypothetical protein